MKMTMPRVKCLYNAVKDIDFKDVLKDIIPFAFLIGCILYMLL